MIMGCFKVCHHINFSYFRHNTGSKLKEGLRDLEGIWAGNDQTVLKQERKTNGDVKLYFKNIDQIFCLGREVLMKAKSHPGSSEL